MQLDVLIIFEKLIRDELRIPIFRIGIQSQDFEIENYNS